MNITRLYKKWRRFNTKATEHAFTLIELLIVMAIVSFLASVFLPTLQEARAKGEDARRVGSLKSLQNDLINQTSAGTTPFTNIFNIGVNPNSEAAKKVNKLSIDTGLTPRTDFSGSTVTGDFDAFSDATSFALVVPMKTDPTKYWCVDSLGISKQVSGRLTSGTGPKSCTDATVATGSSSNTSVFGQTGSQPKGIAIDSMGNVFTSNIGNNTVTKLNSSGALVWTASAGNAPMQIAVDSLGNVYTINSAVATVTKITSGGVSTLAFASVGVNPVSMVIDSNNFLYVGSMNSLTISKINTTTGAVVATFNLPSAPLDMVVNGSGNLYVANGGSDILEVDTSTGVNSVYATANLNTSMLALDSSGFIYIVGTQIGNPSVYEAKIITSPSNVVDLNIVDSYPHDITVDSADNLYISVSPSAGSPGHVQQIIQSGGATSTFGTTNNDPWGIAIDSLGAVYTANMWSDNVSKITQ